MLLEVGGGGWTPWLVRLVVLVGALSDQLSQWVGDGVGCTVMIGDGGEGGGAGR